MDWKRLMTYITLTLYTGVDQPQGGTPTVKTQPILWPVTSLWIIQADDYVTSWDDSGPFRQMLTKSTGTRLTNPSNTSQTYIVIEDSITVAQLLGNIQP